MIELLFVACLQAEPRKCEERSLLFAEQITPYACMMGAQPQLAEWSQTHPGWTISRWSCRDRSSPVMQTKA